jgi:UDP-galactopyranose mutase
MAARIKYDWLIIGAGLSGAVFAREMTDWGFRCLVVDKRPYIGGNCYCEDINGVSVHKHGAHIFHTDSDEIWRYFNKYQPDVRRLGIYAVQALSGGVIYPLPFNMNTFAKVWPDVRTPAEARARIAAQSSGRAKIRNLEDAAIFQVGRDIYELLIKGYTEKQWGRPCSELPPEILGRIPVRFTYDNNYYRCDKVGIPRNGYNELFENLLDGVEVITDCDITRNHGLIGDAAMVFNTSPIDVFFGCFLGRLDWRSLRFTTESVTEGETQGNPVVNYCDHSVRYTRRIEHNLLSVPKKSGRVVFTYEYPAPFEGEADPYYPIQNERNKALFAAYLRHSEEVYGDRMVWGGRLGGYKYLSMAGAITDTLAIARRFAPRKIDY